MSAPLDPLPYRPAQKSTESFIKSEESKRLITTAFLALKRGQVTQAEHAVQEALVQIPEDPSAHEMLGDVQSAQGNFEGAMASYRTALGYEPGRISAENKLARATLRASENNRRHTLGVAYASEGRALVQAGSRSDDSRRKQLTLLSAILPGLGQILGGEFIKGGILLGIYALGSLIFTLLGVRPPYHAGSLLALAVLTVDWLYAVMDAARTGANI